MLNKSMVYPVSVIVGDVNGLKATNDIFGHFEGDRLLKEVASTMMNTIDPGDICMRYGGDEFLIVSFNCNEDKAKELIEFLNLRLSQSEALDFPLSVSFGYSVMTTKQELDVHIEAADRMMYERKNEDEMKTRRNILESLLRTYKFQRIESREHLDNVARISRLIGEKMHLPDTEISELSLIASLHDIGMVNITLDVLKKQGKLSSEEWEIVKKHSTDGYNMTDAIKEFKAVSKYILFHHEQWDGKGYPYGLKGESIPMLSRIITVADAFDTMTRERPYRKKLDKKTALGEIKSNSGTQFDPSIVKLLFEIEDNI
jgi:diguanylate cyclase (GGDEF)-like protein